MSFKLKLLETSDVPALDIETDKTIFNADCLDFKQVDAYRNVCGYCAQVCWVKNFLDSFQLLPDISDQWKP